MLTGAAFVSTSKQDGPMAVLVTLFGSLQVDDGPSQILNVVLIVSLENSNANSGGCFWNPRNDIRDPVRKLLGKTDTKRDTTARASSLGYA